MELKSSLRVFSTALSSQEYPFLWHRILCTEPAKLCYAMPKALMWLLYISYLTLPIRKLAFRTVFVCQSNKPVLSDYWPLLFITCTGIVSTGTCQNLIFLTIVQTYHRRKPLLEWVSTKCENTAWVGKNEAAAKRRKLLLHYWRLHLFSLDVASLQHTVSLLCAATQRNL